MHQQEKRLEEIIARYEQEMQELRDSRKDVMARAKEDARQLLDASNAKIENTIREIREMQAEREKTREARRELDEFKREVLQDDSADADENAIKRKIEQIERRRRRREERRQQKGGAEKGSPEAQTPKPKTESAQPKPGDYVRIKGQTSVGRLDRLSGKKAIVVFGTMQVEVEAKRLVVASPPERKPLQNAVYMSRSTRMAVEERKAHFKPDIDVRGMRADEAIGAVTSFIDDAQLLGMSKVRILHGTGTGALREVIRQYLRTVPGGVTFHDEHIQFGGSGITVVEMKQ